MKVLKSLFTAIVAVCCVACSKGTMTPVTEKINGPLGDFFEVVSRDYAIKDGKVSIEIKRIKDGFPSPWQKGMEVGYGDGRFEPEFTVEFQDADGNVVSKDNTNIVLDSDDLKMIANLGVNESATITFDCNKEEVCKFKISSKFEVHGEQERTISMEGSIGKYPIAMTIHIAPDSRVTGAYYYKSSGRGNYLYVKGVKSNDRITLTEYTKEGKQTGSYSGIFKDDMYKGRFDAESGSYDFTLKATDMEAIDFSYIDFDSFYAQSSSIGNDSSLGNYAENELDDDDSYGNSTGTAEWNEILDAYEKYVDKYISLMKKAAKGDPTALAEYPALMQRAQKLSTKLEHAGSELSSSQLSRYMTISAKMLEAVQEKE